jgi:hypothetical protein
MSSLCLTLYAIMFIELCFNFMSPLRIYPSCGQYFFPVSPLLEIPTTYLGSLGYFLARGLVLLNGCSSEMVMLNGGSRVCSLLSLVLYPKHVYCASLMLTAEY